MLKKTILLSLCGTLAIAGSASAGIFAPTKPSYLYGGNVTTTGNQISMVYKQIKNVMPHSPMKTIKIKKLYIYNVVNNCEITFTNLRAILAEDSVNIHTISLDTKYGTITFRLPVKMASGQGQPDSVSRAYWDKSLYNKKHNCFIPADSIPLKTTALPYGQSFLNKILAKTKTK